MDSTQKGWLKEYLRIKEEVGSKGEGLTDEFKGIHPDQSLYAIIQPTGIMYGHPVGEGGDVNSRVKLNLMNSLLSSFSLIKENQGEYFSTIAETYSEAVTAIGEFYNLVYPELYTSQSSFFGKKKSDDELLEKILEKRLSNESSGDFWSGFFHNSLLFLDIYFFRQYVLAGGDELIINFLRGQKDMLRLDVIKVMTAAAHANRSIEPEERQLFGYLIDSLELPAEKRQYALDYFEKGSDYEETPLPSEDTWVLKKYLFEVAILTTWADRKIEESEEHFLRDYNSKLGFADIEYDRSMIAVEGRGMLGVHGVAARSFKSVAESEASVLLISQSSSEQSICFVVQENTSADVVRRLEAEFADEIKVRNIDCVSANNNVAILTVVGSGMRGVPGVSGRFLGALGDAKINVIAIAQGSSECSISVVVDEAQVDEGIQAIHKMILAQ